jgi:D-alanine-D-alanine ligase
MKPPLVVTCLVDEATVSEHDPQFRDRSAVNVSTEYDVIQALRTLGHAVRVAPMCDDVVAVARALSENRPDIVFNLTELFRWERRQDANIAALLEMLDIPFTGSGAIGLMLCRNKALSKHLLTARRTRVPGFLVLPPARRVVVPKAIRFPLVVKPLYMDGSEGIANASLVRTPAELYERAAMVHARFHQPAIAEQYIEGRELYAPVLGNARLSVLPAREIHFSQDDARAPVLATYKVKWDKAHQKRWGIRFGFAELDRDTAEAVARISRRVFRILQLRDYGRIDMRLAADGRLYVLEVNPNPNLARDDEVGESAQRAGIDYPVLIDRIVRMALRRHAAQRRG